MVLNIEVRGLYCIFTKCATVSSSHTDITIASSQRTHPSPPRHGGLMVQVAPSLKVEKIRVRFPPNACTGEMMSSSLETTYSFQGRGRVETLTRNTYFEIIHASRSSISLVLPIVLDVFSFIFPRFHQVERHTNLSDSSPSSVHIGQDLRSWYSPPPSFTSHQLVMLYGGGY